MFYGICLAVDFSRLEYFAAPAGTAGTPVATGQVPVPALYPYEHYLQGFQHGYSLKQQQLGKSIKWH